MTQIVEIGPAPGGTVRSSPLCNARRAGQFVGLAQAALTAH